MKTPQHSHSFFLIPIFIGLSLLWRGIMRILFFLFIPTPDHYFLIMDRINDQLSWGTQGKRWSFNNNDKIVHACVFNFLNIRSRDFFSFLRQNLLIHPINNPMKTFAIYGQTDRQTYLCSWHIHVISYWFHLRSLLELREIRALHMKTYGSYI